MGEDVAEEDAEAAALAAKKAAKKAKKAAAAEAEAEEEEDPEAAALAAKKAAKKAKKAAAAAAEEEEADDEEPAPKKKKKTDEEAPAPEKEPEPAPTSKGGKDKGKGKGNKEFEIFIGGLPYGTTEDVLRKDFEECGKIVAFRMPLNDEGNCRGIAFCEYTDKESVEKALKFHETEYGGRYLSVRMSGEDKGKGKGKDGKGKGKGNKEHEVFIGCLPYSTTEEVLKKDFAECGEIVNFRLPLNDEGNPRGIAFIEFKDKECCEKALKFHETDYGGRTLTVKMSGDGGKGDKGRGKGKKGKAPSEAKAKSSGCIVAGTGEKKTFSESESE